MEALLGMFGITLPIIAIIVLLILTQSIFIVRAQTEEIIERLGKFHKISQSGLNFKVPFIDRRVQKVDLRIQQMNVEVETKTRDNVFVYIPVSVQYQVSDTASSYYKLSSPLQQIQSYVYDRVRTSLSKLNLDDAFSSKDSIAVEVEETLSDKMSEYGFRIVNTLVTDINPDQGVKMSMNSINAAQREREAAIQLAEADKIKVVKQAEADAESKRLQGEGVANQRKAIVEGLAEQFQSLKEAGIGTEAQSILLMTQYFDTISEVAKNSQTQTLMLPSNPGGMENFLEEIRNSIVIGNQITPNKPAPAAIRKPRNPQPPSPVQ